MLIYHYSDKNFSGYVNPDFFGSNSYSNNSARLSGIKRSYFYANKDNKEYYFNGCQFLYIAEVNKERLYNLNEDKESIVKNLRNTQDIYTEVKKRGYIGLIGDNGYPCAVLFKTVRIHKKEVLQKALYEIS